MNLNQLAEALDVDYRTMTHHAGVLKSNSLVIGSGEGYGEMYFLTPRLEAGIQTFRDICERLHFKLE